MTRRKIHATGLEYRLTGREAALGQFYLLCNSNYSEYFITFATAIPPRKEKGRKRMRSWTRHGCTIDQDVCMHICALF